MIKNLHKLNQFRLTTSKASKLIGTMIILLGGGFATAQFKIDPKFEQLIQQKNKGLDSKANLKKYNEDNQLTTSTIIKPNGEVEELYHAIIYTDNPQALKDSGIIIQSISKTFVTALLELNDINKLRDSNLVSTVMTPQIDTLNNQSNLIESGASLLQSGVLNNTNYTGKDILVGVYDTGIDFTHPDFRDPNDQTKSRIYKIWDQTITANATETPPQGFSYGVEYTQAQINDEIDGTPTNLVRQKDIHGHGTHVAGTAAGNGFALEGTPHKGMAPEATIVFVKGGDGSFPATNTIAALDYFKNVSAELGKPIVVNMSIGGQSSAHDGKSAHEIKVNEFTESGPGRIAVISAGNEGSGNIHKRIDIAVGAKNEFTFQTATTTSTSTNLTLFQFITFNNKEGSPLFTAKLTAPDGSTFSQLAGQFSSQDIKDVNGNVTFTMYVENHLNAATNKRYVLINVVRKANVSTLGTYKLELENISSENLKMDGWITSQNVVTTLVDGDNNYTVGSPGTANEAITVGNYLGTNTFAVNSAVAAANGTYSSPAQTETLNSSSSKGPRADEVRKPDLAAGGTFVVSAKTKDNTDPYIIDGKYYSQMTGTSMSSPAVAGAVALLLQANKNLTAKDVKKRLTENTNKDSFTTNSYTNEFGYGKLNIYKAVAAEINNINQNTSCPLSSNITLANDNLAYKWGAANGTTTFNYGSMFVGVKYTSNITGKLGSVVIFLGNHNATISTTPLNIVVRKVNKDGTPGDIVGSKVVPNLKTLEQAGWNNFDFSNLNINVTSGEEFFIVVNTPSTTLSLGTDTINIDNKTYLSTDNGVTFKASATYDVKMRAIVYENDPAVKQLASVTKTAKQAVALGYNYFVNGCELITRVESSGASPITGNTTAKVWIDSTVKDYVQRRIEVNAENNNTTSTGKVTLFYTQADFDAYNNTNAALKLPTSNTDTENKKNLFVQFFTGTSKDNTGSPSSYNNNSAVTINVAAENVIWNNTYKYWEVTVDAIGFGGYLLTTDKTLGNIENSLNSLSLYPNPVINDLTINLPTNIKNAQIKIVDVTGRTVSNSNVTISNNKVDVSKLSQGVYIVEITTDKGTISKKIIKK